MGFGHRVYKNYDPRAKIVKQSADEILKRIGVNDPLLDIAKALEEKALADDYFIERKLYPNVDFYTGVIYRAMGFPTRMFTVLFALGRLPGWIAHWREMINDPTTKIGRPRQLYIGETERNYPVPKLRRCTGPWASSQCSAPTVSWWSTCSVVCVMRSARSTCSMARRAAWQSTSGRTSTCADSAGSPEVISQMCRSCTSTTPATAARSAPIRSGSTPRGAASRKIRPDLAEQRPARP